MDEDKEVIENNLYQLQSDIKFHASWIFGLTFFVFILIFISVLLFGYL